MTRVSSLSLVASPPDGSYAKVSKLINRRLRNYDKNVRPNDTGRSKFLLKQLETYMQSITPLKGLAQLRGAYQPF